MKNADCDTVLYNGKIVTVDQDFSLAEALAIRAGRFQKVGPNAEVRPLVGPETLEIDLKGHMVLPGFIDTHPHLLHAGIGRGNMIPLFGLRSIESIKNRIGDIVKTLEPGKWLVTMPVGDPPDYFNVPDILEEKRWPTRWDLDEVAPNHPVYINAPIMRAPNTAILNSYALKLMEITRDTPSQQKGAEIVKDPETGEPNGQLHGMHLIYNQSPLFFKLMGMLPHLSLEDKMKGLRATIQERNASGVTTSYEGHYVTSEFLLPCKELWSRNELTMRVYFAYEVDVRKPIDEIEEWMKDLVHATGSGFGDDLVRIGGITVSVDGPIWLGLALMNEPYLDPSGRQTTGVQFIPTDKFKTIAMLAAKNNLRLNSCFGGDKAADITLEVFEEVDQEIPIRDRRWVIQHIQFPTQKQIDQCKKLRLSVTMSPNFEFSKGAEVYVPRLGKDMATRAMPMRKWLDTGIPVAQGTDGAHYQPMFTIWQSLKRIHGLTGESLAGPDQKITREEAIRIYTINGARVLFQENELGSIEQGKLADLVVLDNDILNCPLDEIKDTGILMTMVGGEVVYKKGL
jgi:predicted amidohydrolase YtcJ